MADGDPSGVQEDPRVGRHPALHAGVPGRPAGQAGQKRQERRENGADLLQLVLHGAGLSHRVRGHRHRVHPAFVWFFVFDHGACSYSNRSCCLLRSPSNKVGPDGAASEPWRLCTVQHVEDTKAVIRVLTIWSTGIMLGVIVRQRKPNSNIVTVADKIEVIDVCDL
jgi:hypothetical protein